MDNPRFPFEEYEALFAGQGKLQEQLRREYDGFRAILDQLDQTPVPELSVAQKAAIFRRSWQGHQRVQPRMQVWRAIFQRPAVAFAAGIVLGCASMLLVMGKAPAVVQPASAAAEPLIIEQCGNTQVYAGTLVNSLYPQIENPKVILEKSADSPKPQRVLYGTLDDGKVYVVWNL
jgi:hypothetical protein